MAADYNIYHVVDCITHERMMAALRLGLEMAKESYPHLIVEFQGAINRAMENTESFMGSQNKPHTRPAYKIRK